jgi:hypothetical protein
MLAAFLMEERGSSVLTLVGIGVNDGCGLLWQAARQGGYDDGCETESSTDWRVVSLQGDKYLSAMIYRGWISSC